MLIYITTPKICKQFISVLGHVTMILIKNVKYNKINFTTLLFPFKMTPVKFSLQWLQAGKKPLYFTGEKNQLHGLHYII